jgi:hypothetical protein
MQTNKAYDRALKWYMNRREEMKVNAAGKDPSPEL